MSHNTEIWYSSDTVDKETGERRVRFFDKNKHELLIVEQDGLVGIGFKTANEALVSNCDHLPGFGKTLTGSRPGRFGDEYFYEIMIAFTRDKSKLKLFIDIIDDEVSLKEIKDKIYRTIGILPKNTEDMAAEIVARDKTIQDLMEVIARQNLEIARLKAGKDVKTKPYNPSVFRN